MINAAIMIFSFALLIIPMTSFYDVDVQLMQKYQSPKILQQAIDNGSVDYSTLPTDLKIMLFETSATDQQSITKLLNSVPTLLLIPLFPIIYLVIRWFYPTSKEEKKIDSNERLIDELIAEEKTSNKTEDKVTKVSMDNFKTKEDHPMGSKTHD